MPKDPFNKTADSVVSVAKRVYVCVVDADWHEEGVIRSRRQDSHNKRAIME